MVWQTHIILGIILLMHEYIYQHELITRSIRLDIS